MKLYEMKDKYFELLSKFQEAQSEEDMSALADILGNLEDDIHEKIENCCRVYRTLEAESDAYKQEAERLKGKAVIATNKAERLKDYIAFCLGQGNKMKTELFTLSWRKSQAVEIVNPELIPDQYKRVTTISEPNKVVMKQDLQAGAEIPGAILKDNLSLQIK